MIRGISTARAQDELGFAAWLLGIARNRVLLHFRQIKVHPEVELLPQHVDLSQSIAEEDDPLLVLMARELWIETTDALKRLTPEQQMVVYYRCVLGYSTEEVADLMARRPGTIRALQFRALASLARLLNAGDETEKPERRRHHAG
jgi:RNA polymerase sigma-70 factor (ECF subfamily)